MEYIFKTGGFGLRWYSFLVAVGLALGTMTAYFEAKRRGEETEEVFNALLIAVPFAIIGARIYHVIHEWGFYSDHPSRILRIDEGGIGIYGAVIGSVLAMVIFTRMRKLNMWRWMDIGAPGLLVGQIIGRWGNYFNEELYGKPTDAPWAITIPSEKRLDGYEGFTSFHPLFLYESLLNLIGLGLFYYISRKYVKRLQDGDIALMYGLWYGAVRLALENFRIGNWKVAEEVPTATIISIAAIVLCGGALLYRHWIKPGKGQTANPASV